MKRIKGLRSGHRHLQLQQTLASSGLSPTCSGTSSLIWDMDYVQVAAQRTGHVRSFVHMCLYPMLRDKELPVPHTLKNKHVAIDFADWPSSQISIETALGLVHFDVWSISKRIQATFKAIESFDPSLDIWDSYWQIFYQL